MLRFPRLLRFKTGGITSRSYSKQERDPNRIPTGRLFLLSGAMGTATLIYYFCTIGTIPVKDNDEDWSATNTTLLLIQDTSKRNNITGPLAALSTSFLAPSLFNKSSPTYQDSPINNSYQRRRTIQELTDRSTKAKLRSKYKIHWNKQLGVGAFGAVYLATHRDTQTPVALKKIPKKFTDNQAFQREMNALLFLRKSGGHPHICSLHEHFDEGNFYYVILDLVSGGEVFDHLVSNGAFSEMDASRLFREVASALAYLHGLDVVHGDMKPENLLLSSDNPSDAVIKVVDFGSAQTADSPPFSSRGRTVAYCPPEVLDERRNQEHLHPSMDMWAVGVILYIMLTGVHPYDLSGRASDEEVQAAILSKEPIPLRNSPITAHLSESAIELIEKLMDPNPTKRITAHQMLEHSWVTGETANQSKIAFSDKKLASFRRFKSKLEAKVFADIVKWSDDTDTGIQSVGQTSLLEKSFRSLGPQSKGIISSKDLKKRLSSNDEDFEAPPLSLSTFSDLLADSMKNKYLPKGSIIYKEGERGDVMYFINSGVVEVSTSDGTKTARGPGNYFGEGALLHKSKERSATVRCKTPVHVIEISREFFEKYLATSENGLLLSLKEKDIIRKKNRVRRILRQQKNLIEREFKKDEILFREGTREDKLFVVEYGKVDVTVDGKRVFTANPGNICGEFSVLSGSPRNSTGICATDKGCIVHEMLGQDFRRLVATSPSIKESIRHLSHRRDFKKAVVKRLQKEFPYNNPQEAFDAVRGDKDWLDIDTIGGLMRELDPGYTDEEIRDIVEILDLRSQGRLSFDDFKKVFIADIRTADAM